MKTRYAFIALSVLLIFLTIYAGVCFNMVGKYPDKLWLHRVNSLEKMQEKKEIYPNIETDIVYRSEGERRFDITHESDTTFHLYLEDYLPYLAKGNQRMWLDIKNITAENHQSMLARLDSLISRHHIAKNRFIVESTNWQALSAFTRKGFYTSYYVPFDKPSRLSETQLTESLDTLRRITDSGHVCALSFPGWWYTAIKKGLNRDIDLLTWKHRTTQWEFMLNPFCRKMLHDPQLKVILLKDKGKFHR